MNWRDEDTVLVGWVGRPELGNIRCDVVRRNLTNQEPHGVVEVQWACGALSAVAWCHSQERYVFIERYRSSSKK